MKISKLINSFLKICLYLILVGFVLITASYIRSESWAYQIIHQKVDTHFTETINTNFILPDTLERIMDYKFTNEKFEESFQIANRLVYVDEKSDRAYYVISIFNNKQGKNDDALYYIEKAIELNPNNSRYLIPAGLIEFLNNDLDSASAYLVKTQSINSKQEGIDYLEKLLKSRKL